MRVTDVFDWPPGPLFGLLSTFYIDKVAFAKRMLMGYRKQRKEAFRDTLKPGDPMPGVRLKTTDDAAFDLSDFFGKKNIVIEFGAITGPPYRRQGAGVEDLQEKYKDEDVVFFVVYSKEPHAGETSHFKKYAQHTSYEHKKQYAQELVEEFGMKVPVLIDDLDESVVHAFGRMPNMTFIVDKEGRIAYKSDWMEAERVEELLDELLAEQKTEAATSA